MTPADIENVVRLARRTGMAFIASADARARPHLACAAQLAAGADGCLEITQWFCPGTVANIQENPEVAIVVWDSASDTGYQVLGIVERVLDTAMLDGYVPGEEEHAVPQVERKLTGRVRQVLAFTRRPHSDIPE